MRLTRFLYLHGFASSPASRKARFFAERLRAEGVDLEIADLEQGDFSCITVSGQLKIIEELMAGQRSVLIGSSLGGYLASLAAGRNAAVERLLLLAPAFDFAALWEAELGPQRLSEWKQNGTMDVFHYGAGEQRALNWDFLEDARQYRPFPAFPQPALIFHGEQDFVVPVERSERFAAEQPNARLRRLTSGHELTDVLDRIWQESKQFLLAAEA